MKKKHCLRILAVVTAIGTVIPAFAEDKNDKNVFSLGEVLVTTPNLDAVPGTVETIDQDKLRDFNRETVGRALNLLPGVTMTEGGARNEQMITLRGFDLRQVPVFVDGIPVYVSYDGYLDLGRFNTFDLAAIEVAKGFSSVLFGPNTLGGAINLVSRRPTKLFEGDITTGMYFNRDFNYNGYHVDANAGGNHGTWYWQASASYLKKDQFQLSDDFRPERTQFSGDRNNSDQHDRKINLKFGITPNITDEYSLNVISQRGEKGTPEYAGKMPTTGPNAVSNRYWRWPYWDKDSVYFASNTAIGEKSYIKFRAYYDSFKNSIDNYDSTYSFLASKPFYSSRYDDYTYGASGEFGTKLTESNTLKFAAHIKEDIHREYNYVSNNAGTKRFKTPTLRDKDQTTSFGIEDTQRFGDKLDLVAGVSRDERNTRQAENYVSAPGGNLGTVQPFQKDNASAWNPQIGLFYHLSPTDEVHASVSRKSRFPTIKDRYSYRLGTAIPNAALDAEKSTNYELGGSSMLTGRTRISGSIFYDDIRDMIQNVTIVPTPAGCSSPCSQMQNIGHVRTSGLELSIDSSLTDTLNIGANYTVLSRTNETNSSIRFTDVPRQKLFTYTKWQVTEPFSVLGSVEADSSRYSSTTGAQVAGGFGIANLKGIYRFNQSWSAEAGVNNLFDRNYELIEGYPMEGRNFFVNATFKF
jgi:iron complex outermembrane receptor protein